MYPPSCLRGIRRIGSTLCTALVLLGCSDDMSSGVPSEDFVDSVPFELRFAAMATDRRLACGSVIDGLGMAAAYEARIGDLRFYVSDIIAVDDAGDRLALDLDENEFQYADDSGEVALVDLTGTDADDCHGDATLGFAEATARMNDRITGRVARGAIAGVEFSVGVPQALMKSVIANNAIEEAPSPLREMYWSWATGYRHFVLNMRIADSRESGAGATIDGNVHIGSRGCGTDPAVHALADQSNCRLLNTPRVVLADFDPATSEVLVHLDALLADLDFVEPLIDYTGETPEAVLDAYGEPIFLPGVQCHSAPLDRQPDCGAVFASLGLDPDTGAADPARNQVFRAR